MNRTVLVVVVTLLVLLMLCCCVMVAAFTILIISGATLANVDLDMNSIFTESVPFPEEQFNPPSSEAFDMMNALSDVDIPENDFADLSERLLGVTDVPITLPAKAYQVGDNEQFWLMNNATDENFRVTAELVAVAPHVFFWVEDGLNYNMADVNRLVNTFEDSIYPINRAFFGTEWNPGIDNDEHIYLVYSRGIGGNVAGYFSAIDSIHPILKQFSNAHETFMINADVVNLGEEYIYSVLAHEFQHMIHWYQDRNETSWMNEGFSELAVSLNGYPVGGWHNVYLSDRDVQLNIWPVEPEEQGVHYGSSYLFMQYFLDRFGAEATKALVQEDLDGLTAIDQVMEELEIPSDQGNNWMTAEEIFIDWTIASTINDPLVQDGQYAYQDADLIGKGNTFFSDSIRCSDTGWTSQDVSQFGVESLTLTCDLPATLRFQAVGEVGLLPETPYEGEKAFWSNRSDESDTRLTRQFDLTGVTGDVTLDYMVWFELEEDYDYGYVIASVDGNRWDMLETRYGTMANPQGSNYGWAYTGSSNGWVKESLDLSRFAGEKVWIRFEYVTDANLNDEGLLLDEVSINAINYYNGFEIDDGGWKAEGFVRVSDRLAQRMSLTVIKTDNIVADVDTHVFYGGETVEIVLEDINEWDSVMVLVSGLTRYTIQPANYRLDLVVKE